MGALPGAYRPPTIADGYWVQDTLVTLMGDDVVGWKIGSTPAQPCPWYCLWPNDSAPRPNRRRKTAPLCRPSVCAL